MESPNGNVVEHLESVSPIPLNGKDRNCLVQRVLVGICLKGHTPPESYHDRMIMAFNMGCVESEARMRNDPVRYEFKWFSCGEIFVPFAREQLAMMAIQHNCEWLFMIDDDMIADPNLFFNLVRHDKDIVAGLAFTRNPPHNPVMYQTIEGYDPNNGGEYFKTLTVQSYPRNKLVECDGVGFGAVVIKTDALKKMGQPWFMSTSPTGEDVLFCNKAKKLGFHVFMDTSQKMGHLGNKIVITEEYADRMNNLDEKSREKLYGQYTKYPSMDLNRGMPLEAVD
jgi:hypothetical protein